MASGLVRDPGSRGAAFGAPRARVAAGMRSLRSPMRRVALLILLLAVGAVLNLGVAWLLAWPRYTGNPVGLTARDAKAIIEREFPAVPDLQMASTAGVSYEDPWRQTVLCITPQGGDVRSNVVIQTTRAGWPVAAFEGTLRFDGRVETLEDTLRIGGPGAGAARLLPYRPLPLGVAVGTVAWAGVALLVALAIRAAWRFVFRRQLRARRGLCAACGYPVGRSPVCTECGAEVPRSSAARSA